MSLKTDTRRTGRLLACVLCSLFLLGAPRVCSAQQQEDWQAQIRARVSAHDLPGAIAIADARLAAAPNDAEAHYWRGRILAWTQKWPEAEAEYGKALTEAPKDSDILFGLAQLLYWQQRYTESLELLDCAQEIAPQDASIALERAVALAALGRRGEAEQAYRRARALDPENPDVLKGLASLKGEPRQELVIGNETDAFNYTNAANTQTVALVSHWRWNWITTFSSDSYQRFGEQAEKFTGATTWRITHADAVSFGGAAAHDSGIVAKSEAFFNYDRGIHVSKRGFVRGLEATFGPHWYWFSNARVLTLTSDVLLYLPGEWTWDVTGIAARSHFSGMPADWQPSGMSRVNLPLGRIASRRLWGNVFYQLGAENFAQVDQIGSFSAHTYGGGTKFELTPHQAFNFFAAYQKRTNGQTQTSFGAGYDLRF
ncbi:MAG TPA: tetratricopeptide repeat protein [Candidatus Acidoferrales bacterium]|nr:tetratricopeptide repeat protein [Candidatus Acidoferrales bacterium]